MRIKIFFVLALLLLPLCISRAAFDDLTLEPDAVITVGEYDLGIYGSDAIIETLVVNDGDFVVTLQSGSTFVVTSADRVAFVHDAPESNISEEVCAESESRLGLTASGEVEVTVSLSGTCVVEEPEEDDGGPSSHRRSGSDSSTGFGDDTTSDNDGDTDAQTIINKLRELIMELIAQGGTIPPGAAPYFSDTGELTGTYTRDLDLGDTGADVKALQTYLINKNTGPAASALAAIGATGYFGPLTQAALAEFQLSVGITPALGYFGPITRVYVQNHP